MSRGELAELLRMLVGPEAVEWSDPSDGWPALGSVQTGDTAVDIAAFLAPVGLSYRDRDDVERRFQNPGQRRPIVIPAARLPLLLGIWHSDPLVTVPSPVLVSAEPRWREGKTTRWSTFPRLDAMRLAAATGWHEGETANGERVTYLQPRLLPALVEATRLEVRLPAEEARQAVVAADAAADTEADVDRRRRAVSSLVRAARFAGEVRTAYSGRCAMCGLGLGLVESAHILPVSVVGAPDKVSNGLALCANHHRAFDRHLIWVNPTTREVRLHSSVEAEAAVNPAARAFLEGTLPLLREPAQANARPAAEMFRRRYKHYRDDYRWAPGTPPG